jgi:alkanesulfonate monooxygenase SsuD/methylene tetrahydromethanopterin reductase-like flavin-dependent oxidoreductase (luciferase family)
VSDLAVALTWHTHRYPDLLALVRRAEALGYRAAYVDGDVSMIASRGEGDVLDGWTVTAALLASTARIEIGSIRLVHHWNPARLAQAVATAERIAPGRLRFLLSIGAYASDARFGLPFLPARERLAWLDELVPVLRALWTGETVTAKGRFFELDAARVRPAIERPGGLPVELAGRGPRLLELVAAHADHWDVNLPPVARRGVDAAPRLEAACRARGRNAASIGRSMWLWTRVGPDAADAAVRAEYRRWNPWFASVPDAELREAIVAGPAGSCRRRLGEIRTDLGIDLPVLDLAGLDRAGAERVMEELAGS